MIFGSEKYLLEENFFKKAWLKTFGDLHFGAYARFFYINDYITKNKIMNNKSLILDAGCGKGNMSFYYAIKNKSIKIIALDINQKLIKENIQITYALNLKNIQFKDTDLKKINYVNEFEVIFCIDVLEHIDEDEKVLFLLYQALKHKGMLILHMPQRGRFLSPMFGFRILKKGKEGRNRTCIQEIGDRHIREGYNKAQLIKLLKKIGFSVLVLENTFGFYGMLGHTLFELVRPCSRICWLIVKPVLKLFLFLDCMSPRKEGGGLLVVCAK